MNWFLHHSIRAVAERNGHRMGPFVVLKARVHYAECQDCHAPAGAVDSAVPVFRTTAIERPCPKAGLHA